VRDGIDIQIIHDIAGVVIYLDSFIGHLTDDLSAGRSGSGVATVLLDNDQHSMITSPRPQLLKALHPELAVTSFSMTTSYDLRDAPRGGLPDPVGQDLHGV